jgi:hypothetical protein
VTEGKPIFVGTPSRVEAHQPGPLCGRCSVAALCGVTGHFQFEVWIRNGRLVHTKCPICERHGAVSTRTAEEVFPAPDYCPVVLLGKEFTKTCIPCYRGHQVQFGGTVEPEFEPEFEEEEDVTEKVG